MSTEKSSHQGNAACTQVSTNWASSREEYRERIILPLEGNPDTRFFTRSKLHIATGYIRIVIGGRGPYIEYSDVNICREAIAVPATEQWRLRPGSRTPYYEEYRSQCVAYVKIYRQLRVVDYADYRVGYWYISPFDLETEQYPVLVRPRVSRAPGLF